jgi:hypothetical protein
MRRSTLLGLLFAGAAVRTAGAQLPPDGGQFQVNTYTSQNQGLADVSVGADGRFVVVWQSFGSSGGDTSFYSIQGQRFGADGSPLGAQFQVNSYTTSEQQRAAVSIAPNGRYVVVWESLGSTGGDTSQRSVQGRRYESDGTSPLAQFQVNGLTSGFQNYPDVAVGPADDFVVAWQSDSPAGGGDVSGYSIQARRYGADSLPIGPQFRVNTYTTSAQKFPAIARGGDGRFVIVWQSFGSSSDNSFESVQGQRYSANGTPVGAQFQVNTYTTNGQAHPAVAMAADGRFVVVWESNGAATGDTSGWSIRGRRYAADGAPSGPEFQVNSYTTNDQRYPDVTASTAGDFLVVWHSFGSGGDDDSQRSVQAQRYASNGQPLGGQFQVNTYVDSQQVFAAVAAPPGGDPTVVWDSLGSSGTDALGWSIQAQRYRVTLFVDGFESGTTDEWSDVQP